MKKLALFGKEYIDTILFVDGVNGGETNDCNKVVRTRGGLYNFSEVTLPTFEATPLTSGLKKAYIISDSSLSKRTSFVLNLKESILSSGICNKINDECDWLHVCYLDDIECHKDVLGITIPYSLDFCTDKSRQPYLEALKRSTIVFDSRERKQLYIDIIIDTPIILHDEFGFEIIKNGKIIFKRDIQPIEGLNVNGAGDMYAANFIKNYEEFGLFKSATMAMIDTTNILVKKENS